LDDDILVQQQRLKQTHSLQHWEIIDLIHCLFKRAQQSQGNNKRVPDFSIQSGRVALETPEGNPMAIKAKPESGKPTALSQIGKAYLYMFLGDKNLEEGDNIMNL